MEKGFIPVRTKAQTIKIDLDSVLVIENNLRKVIIYTKTGEIAFYGKTEDLKAYLDERFYQCHGSCIINLDNVLEAKDNVLYLQGGKRVFLGRNNYRLARKQFNLYLGLNK